MASKAARPIWPSPIFSWRSLWLASSFLLVVDVDGFQPVEADDLIEGHEDVIELMDDVVAAVKDVARIEQTPILSFMTALSMMAANSSKVRPTSVPFRPWSLREPSSSAPETCRY